jgi:N-acylneuraminate cytidylyltransferase/CMP-N,N'-diacetyllegionaminic acid synthase
VCYAKLSKPYSNLRIAMYKKHRILCIIPARGDSMGIPRKNIKIFCGKPLIAYTIEQAKRSKYIDRVIVSTDDLEISEISLRYGAEIPFTRPAELSGDNISTIDVLLHAIEWVEKKEQYMFDILTLLHVTAPLRKVEDIDNCIELLVRRKGDSIFSVTEAQRNPYFNMVEVTKTGAVKLVKKGNFPSRQTAPKVYEINACVYVWWKNTLKEKRSIFSDKSQIYIMPKERSIDIDDYIDFKIAEMLMNQDVDGKSVPGNSN